ncbi:phage major capsid protein [Mycobacterium sp. pUA109]|uniref:phage major capsid protein n=1 Tax=Mycobacterium sp. pUA109 TaxID=3238982 RepID=UPI00351AF51C
MPSNEFLAMLEGKLADARAERRAIVNEAKRDGRDNLDNIETMAFREVSATVESLRKRIDDTKAEIVRSGHGPGGILETTALGHQGTDADTMGRRLATDIGHALQKMSGEQRAVISGSVDVPVLVDLPVPLMDLPFPARLIDAFGNRISIDSYVYEFYQQTARTNNAAPVADLGQKPTSTLTVEAVSGRAQIIATLSEPAPIRIWWDFPSLVDWLHVQLIGSIYDAMEQQAVSGNGTGLNATGILNQAGTTQVPFTTDLPTTLRSAITAMQTLGERPTGWALNPHDAAAIDLLRWGTGGGFLSEGYANNPVERYGTSANIFGDNSIQRIVTPHVPQGTAILADFKELALFLRHSMRIDVATTGGSPDLFQTNAFQLRAEIPCGIGILRPQAFAVVSLGGGS